MNPIARELRRRGHRVLVATAPSFKDRLPEEARAAFVPIGPGWAEDDEDLDAEAGGPSAPEALRGRSGAIATRFFGEAERVAADLHAAWAAQGPPDLAVFDYTLLGGPPAAEAAGVPWATLFGLTVPFAPTGWPPFGSHWPYTASWAARARYCWLKHALCRENRALYRPVRRLWRRAGRLVRDPWEAYRRFSRLGIVGSLPECDFPLPASLAERIHYVGPLVGEGEVAAPLDEEATRFIEERALGPLVHVTLGLTFSRAGSLLRQLVEALGEETGDEPIRLLVATGHLEPATFRTESVCARTDRVLVRRLVPHLALFPKLDALVCHGGANTLMKALQFGVPSLIVPLDAEQRSNAARFVHAGVARMLLPQELRPDTIRAAVQALCRPDGTERSRARALARLAGGMDRERLAAALLERACESGAR
ncbi:glycosyltransferase [Nitrospira sp. Kam-Ns4a]